MPGNKKASANVDPNAGHLHRCAEGDLTREPWRDRYYTLSSLEALATRFLADPSSASGVGAVPINYRKRLVGVCTE